MAAKFQDQSEVANGKRDHIERLISQNCDILLRCHPYNMSALGEGMLNLYISGVILWIPYFKLVPNADMGGQMS